MQNKYYDMLNIFHLLIAFKMKMTTFFKLQKFMNGVTRDLIEDSKPIVLNYVNIHKNSFKRGNKNHYQFFKMSTGWGKFDA